MNTAQTPEEQNFVNRTKANVGRDVDPAVSEVLALMLKSDLPYFDIHYLEKRARQIIEEKFKDIDFSSKEIQRLRKAAFKWIIKEAQKVEIPLAEDPNEINKMRDDRCEPIAQAVAEKVLSLKLLEADPDWIESVITQDEEILSKSRVRLIIDGIFDGLQIAINESLLRAGRNLWGKAKEDISMKDIDRVLKAKK